MRFNLRTVIIAAVLFSWAVTASAATTYLRIPHVAVGGTMTSYLDLSETGGFADRAITLHFYNDLGNPYFVNIRNYGNNSNFQFALKKLGEVSLEITGGDILTSGWVQITADGIGSLNAALRFANSDNAGKVTYAVGILPSEPNYYWTIPVDKRNASDWTGMAMSNPWNQDLVVSIQLYQNGNLLPNASTTKQLKALGHWAGFLEELFPNFQSSMQGPAATLRLSCDTYNFSAVALRADGLQQFSSLPGSPRTQMWTFTYNEPNGTVYTGTWSWQFTDGTTFIGNELHPWENNTAFRLRGALDASKNYFVAEWFYNNLDGSQGTVLFQGIPLKQGPNDIITGSRTQLDKSGVVLKTLTFQATRLY
jgi:hypothetical protein